MANTLILTLLPNGFTDDGRFKLSVVAGFQLDAIVSKFEASPITTWPRLSNELPLMALQAGTDEPVPLLRVPAEAADGRMWSAIFGPDAPIGAPPATTAEAAAYRRFRTPLAHGAAHRAIAGLYDEALTTSPAAPLRREHPVAQAIVALAELTGEAPPAGRRRPVPSTARELLDPDRLTPERLDDAVRELTLAGRADAARVAVLAPALRRVTVRTTAAGPTGPTGPKHEITPIQRADVQQVLGLLLDHPALARRLGLIIDVTAAPGPGVVDGELLRVDLPTGATARRLFDRVRLPPSRVRIDRGRRLFVMATRPGAVTEVVDGMLDLAPDSDKYQLSDLDVPGLVRQLGALGRRLATVDEAVALPIRRDAGLTLAQAGRADVVDAALDAVTLWTAPPEEVEGEPVLYADDVTGGYRIDVSRNGGRFRSLMRRRVEYRIGALPSRAPTLTTEDEGMVEGLVAAEQSMGADGDVLDVSEAIVGWDGFSLAAALPGAVVDTGVEGGPGVDPPPTSVPGYPVEVSVRPVPGSVVPLRYGDTYELRARAVDLGGNSLTEDDDDGGRVSAPVRFLRHQQVAAPTIVPVRPLGGGETLTRVVVRSDGEGNVLGDPAERHLAPPPVTARMAERHGMFDALIGPRATAAERERLRIVASLQGSFSDPVVTRPDGTSVPAAGIGVAAPPGTTAAELPLPPGTALPAGQYVFHDTARLVVPYVTDPVAAGATLIVEPPHGPRHVTIGFGQERWPESAPARLRVDAAATTSFGVDAAGPAPRLVARLAPGEEVAAALSSPLRSGMMTQFERVPAGQEKPARDGLVPLLSLRQPVTMLHATRKPAADPTVTVDDVDIRQRGDTHLRFRATVAFHAPTTGKVDLVAEWDEVIDPLVGDVTTGRRRITLASFTPKEGESSFTVRVRHDFGDTKHRAVRILAVAATKFRDCFPELAEGDPLTLRESPAVDVDVLNTRVPPPLQVHSVVPVYRWVRRQSPGRHEAARHVTGVRVYVERPGATTGDGEELGVVVFKSQSTANNGILAGAGRPLVSRWGDDPLNQMNGDVLPANVPPLAANFPAGTATEEPLLADLGQLGDAANITTVVGHRLRFAADRGLWYADIDIAGAAEQSVFVRLGVVRRQPHSIDPCRVSRVRDTGWFTMPPSVGVVLQADVPGVTKVRVAIDGLPHKVTARVAPRLGDGDDGSASDLLTDDLAVTRVLSQISPVNVGFPAPFLTEQLGPVHSRVGTIDARAPELDVLQRRWRGRIVVLVERIGTDFVEDKDATQPVFVEVVDMTAIHGPVPTG